MATYLQGVQDYIPDIQPFQPDLNFYKGVMDTKEAQYKAGFDKISNMYGQLLNSPLTRDINNERREKFFTQIASDIERLASVDLSLEQNVNIAGQVFQPLIDDKNVIKDMAWTKNLYSEFARSEAFRNCTDEKKCGGKWWEDGQRALQYQQMDFAKATDEQALGFANAKYTPYVNVVEKATKLAKDMGFNVQTVTWSPDGRYIVTTKNGPNMTMDLTNYFQSVYGNDPQVQELYKTKAYLQRKDFVYSNVEKYGSEEAAEQYYLTSAMDSIEKQMAKVKAEALKQQEAINLKKGIVEDEANKGTVDLEDTEDPITKAYNQLLEEQNSLTSTVDQYDNTLSLVDKSTLLGADIETMRWKVDQAVAGGLLNDALFEAANSYSMLNMEQKIEADPYAKASFENSLAMGRMAMQHEYNKQMVEFKVAMGLVEDVYGNVKKGRGGKISKQDYLNGNYNRILSNSVSPFGNPNATDYKPVSGLPGSTAELGLYEEDVEKAKTSIMNRDGSSGAFLQGTYDYLTGIIHTKPGSKEAKLAEGTLRDIIGSENVDFAIQAGYMDKNFNILDNYQFASFINANRDNLMQAANKGIKDTAPYLFMTSDNGKAMFSNLMTYNQTYETFRPLAQKFEDLSRQYVKEVKNTFLSKDYAQLNVEYDETGKEKKSQNWMSRAGRWFEDYGVFIPGAAGLGILAKAGGYIKDAITGEKSHLADYIPKQIDNYINSPSKKNREMFLDNIFMPDGYTFKTKDAFVLDSYKAYTENTGWLKTRMDTFNNESIGSRGLEMLIPGGVGAIRNWIDAFEVNPNEVKNYLGRVYDDMVKSYKSEYSSGRLVGYNQGTHSYANAMEIIVDGADFQSEGFGDFMSIMDNYFAVQDQPGVKIVKGMGGTDADYKNAKSSTMSTELLHKLYTDIANVTYNYNDPNRPMVRMINQRIAANDANMTAYTFQVNDAYIIANKGSEKKPGPLDFLFDGKEIKKNANTFTLYIPKDYAQNSYIQKTTKGPMQTLFEQTGNISLDYTDAYKMNISRRGDNIIATVDNYIFDENTGEYATIPMQIPISPDIDLDNWIENYSYGANDYYNTRLYGNIARKSNYKRNQGS